MVKGDAILTAALIIAVVSIISSLYYMGGNNLSRLSFGLVLGNTFGGLLFIVAYSFSIDIPLNNFIDGDVLLYQAMIGGITFILYLSLLSKKRYYENMMNEWRRVSGEKN